MGKKLLIIIFCIGLAALAIWVGFEVFSTPVYVTEHIQVIVHDGNGNQTISVTNPPDVLPRIPFFTVVVACFSLIILGIGFRERDRWLALTFAGVLLTGLSLSWIYSLGGFLWPVGLVLLMISKGKLRQYRASGAPGQEAKDEQ